MITHAITALMAIAAALASALIVFIAAPALSRILPALGQLTLAVIVFALLLILLGFATGIIRIEIKRRGDDGGENKS